MPTTFHRVTQKPGLGDLTSQSTDYWAQVRTICARARAHAHTHTHTVLKFLTGAATDGIETRTITQEEVSRRQDSTWRFLAGKPQDKKYLRELEAYEREVINVTLKVYGVSVQGGGVTSLWATSSFSTKLPDSSFHPSQHTYRNRARSDSSFVFRVA
jgi:hypothetical protein